MLTPALNGNSFVDLEHNDRIRLQEIRIRNYDIEKRLSTAIFGRSQKKGIRAFMRSHYTDVQVGVQTRGASCFIVIGHSGTGKTEMAKAYASLITSEWKMITCHQDLTTTQIFGAYQKEDGSIKGGYIKPRKYTVIVLDEATRMSSSTLNDFGPVASEGQYTMEEETFPVAPDGHHLIVLCTTNPRDEIGTREVARFWLDRVIGGAIFDLETSDEFRVKQFLIDEHWNKIKNNDVLKPIVSPESITYARKFISEHTETPPSVLRYTLAVREKIEILANPRWAEKIQVPQKWKEAFPGGFPSEPFMKNPGGRFLQHWKGLSRADTVFSYGETRINMNAVQAMFESVMTHRVIYLLAEGGYDVSEKVYGDDKLALTKETISWLLKTAPKDITDEEVGKYAAV